MSWPLWLTPLEVRALTVSLPFRLLLFVVCELLNKIRFEQLRRLQSLCATVGISKSVHVKPLCKLFPLKDMSVPLISLSLVVNEAISSCSDSGELNHLTEDWMRFMLLFIARSKLIDSKINEQFLLSALQCSIQSTEWEPQPTGIPLDLNCSVNSLVKCNESNQPTCELDSQKQTTSSCVTDRSRTSFSSRLLKWKLTEYPLTIVHHNYSTLITVIRIQSVT